MRTRHIATLAGLLLALGGARGAHAIQAAGPTSLHNGFPVWWVDNANFPVAFFPTGVLTAPVVPTSPFSVQTGFGPESFWWAAGAGGAIAAAGIVFEVAMEAAYLTETPANGDQFPFARTRVRADNVGTGNCTITTPYQTFTEAVTGTLNFTSDVSGVPPTFAGVLGAPHTHFFFAGAAAVGPGGLFSGTGPIVAAPVGNGTTPANLTASVQCPAFTVTTTEWDVTGIAFNVGPNLAPTAVADAAATRSGTPVTIDVALNDTDPVGAGNVHGLNPIATGIVVPLATVATPPRLAIGAVVVAFGPNEPVTTARGGTVTKETNGRLTYTPAPGVTGTDTFQYVIQDVGGIVSGQAVAPRVFGTTSIPAGDGDPVPATVTVTIEDLVVGRAELRTKLLRWRLEGTTSALFGPDGLTANVITLHASSAVDAQGLPTGPVIGTATVAADGAWAFEGQATALPAAGNTVLARSANGVVSAATALRLR
ncbi:MAG: Ig-like domain-containing protein [Deferrisomatales bacterium]